MDSNVVGLLLNKDILTKETAQDVSDYLIYNEREIDGVMTTESGFITSVKEFFLNIINKVKNVLRIGLDNVDINQKYYIDKINLLRDLNKTLNNLNSRKFSEIEDIELPIMMGMKLDYKTTVFELSNIVVALKDINPAIEEFNLILNKLVGNYSGIRLSSDPKLFTRTHTLVKINEKLNKILGELTEVKKPKDIKKARELFSNISGIKDTRDNYMKVYKDTLDFDLVKYKNSINLMGELLEGWIATLHGEGSEIKSSTNVVTIVKANTSLFADITTSIGIYLAILNQTSAFFMSDLKILSGETK